MREKTDEPKAIKKSVYGFLPSARRRNPKKLRQLLDDGANIERRNQMGETALMQASMCGRLQCVQLLLDRGAKINAIDKNGNSAISYASMYGHIDILKLLLDHGANVDIRGYQRKTPLIAASQSSELACVALLLERGADVTPTDRLGKTASDYCTSDEIRKLLEDAANATDYVLK